MEFGREEVSADPKNDLPQLEARLLRSLAAIEQNPKLSDEEKQKYTAVAREFLASYIALRPPPGNIEAVRPYQAQLRDLLGDAERFEANASRSTPRQEFVGQVQR